MTSSAMDTCDSVPISSNPFIASMTGPSSTLPLAFNADILHLFPVPETSRGGSTKPSDQRAYLYFE